MHCNSSCIPEAEYFRVRLMASEFYSFVLMLFTTTFVFYYPLATFIFISFGGLPLFLLSTVTVGPQN